MHLIDSEATLDPLLATLRGQQRFFVDTEFESSRRGQLLCLIQVSVGTETFLVDTIRLTDLRALGAVMAEPMHDGVRHHPDARVGAH